MLGLRKRTWIIGAVVAALIGSAAVASRYHNSSMEDRADFATYMVTKKLELNKDQEAALDKLAANWVSAAGTMKSFRKSMFDEVKALAAGEDLTIEQVNGLRDKIKSEIDSKIDAIAPEFIAFYNGLNTEQKAKIVARLDHASERMENGKRGHMRRGRHGDDGRRHNFWHDSQ